jgi:hypothetical protein
MSSMEGLVKPESRNVSGGETVNSQAGKLSLEEAIGIHDLEIPERKFRTRHSIKHKNVHMLETQLVWK